MAGIKSTMDLVMEKVGKMEITPEEKERFRREEVQDQAQRILNRYLVQGGQKDVSALKRELKGQRAEVKGALAEMLISTYSLEDPSSAILECLETLQGERGKEIVNALRELTLSYQREREEEFQEIQNEIREELVRKGISGTAVEPNPDSNPRWTDFLRQLNEKYEDRRQEILNKTS